MTYPNDENGRVLAEMDTAGIDLTAEHSVEFFQLFERKEQAEAFANHIRQLDIAEDVKLHPDQTPNVWDVDCVVNLVPSYENICKFEQKFEQWSHQFEGYNDGWGIQG